MYRYPIIYNDTNLHLLISEYILLPPSLPHSSNPSRNKEHQSNSIACPSGDDQHHIAAPIPLQILPSNRNTSSGSYPSNREASCEAPPIIFRPKKVTIVEEKLKEIDVDMIYLNNNMN